MLELKDILAVKILLMYFLDQVGRPMPPRQLNEIVSGSGVVNYFLYTEAVSSMLEAGIIRLEEAPEGSVFVLSEQGRAGAEEFRTMVPKSFRDKILAAGMRFFAKMKNANTVKLEVIPLPKGCEVRFCAEEGELQLMELHMFAPDEQQAELIRTKIEQNPAGFYSKVLDFVLENEEYVPEVEG